MFNRMASRLLAGPTPQVLFMARGKKTTDLKPAATPALPLYYLITSGGDGSYSPSFFTSAAERNKALEWLDANDNEPVCDSYGTLEAKDIHPTAQSFIDRYA
ncbi:MAG: hypothetical protein K2X66_00545 [Cyanobacteria bacterium]|nr:hypothetical protein [Cyanobacteriota bacterium]